MDIQGKIKRVDSVYSDSLDDVSVRLLRISQLEDGVFVGTLKTFQLASAPRFYAASYVWGKNVYSHTPIHLDEGPISVLSSLIPFLNMITSHGDFNADDWWWIDSLSINLEDCREREKQIRIMAGIYESSKMAIIWLGKTIEGDSDCSGAIAFLRHLARYAKESAFSNNTRAMHRHLADPAFMLSGKSVTQLLTRPWWTRVWTLQEFVLPKQARLYCGADSISRGKFKSAIYGIFLYNTLNTECEHDLVPRTALDGAFNRRRIHQWYTTQASQGMSLVSILAYLGNHSSSDPRDRIYSVLGLITPQDRDLVGDPEYSSTTENQFAKLVRSFWQEYNSLDIVCFVHIFSQSAGLLQFKPAHDIPSWAPDWRVTIEFASPVPLMASQSASHNIGNFRPLRQTIWESKYNAPGPRLREMADVYFSDDLKVLCCDGVIVDTIHGLGGLDGRELRCQAFICAAQGHAMLQSSPIFYLSSTMDITPREWLDKIARSIILDRQDKYLCYPSPPHYITDFLHLCHMYIAGESVDWSFSTWFDENKQLYFGSHTLEQLLGRIPAETPFTPLPSYPIASNKDTGADTGADTFLSRFHDTVRKKSRRLFIGAEGTVGMAPCLAREGDIVVVLFGCNIPLVLRKGGKDASQIIGEAYAHGFMNGEVESLIERGERQTYRFRLV